MKTERKTEVQRKNRDDEKNIKIIQQSFQHMQRLTGKNRKDTMIILHSL